MRPIKYRAYVKPINRLCEVVGIDFKNKFVLVPSPGKEYPDAVISWSFDSIDLMEFTGLLDKNGKEIYEGDILEHQYHGKAEVVYAGPCFKAKGDDMDIYLGDEAKKLRRIIGNVHKNPELLK